MATARSLPGDPDPDNNEQNGCQHLVSDAFAFLSETEIDKVSATIEHELTEENVYSNISGLVVIMDKKKKEKETETLHDEQSIYLNISHAAKTGSDLDAEYVNFSLPSKIGTIRNQSSPDRESMSEVKSRDSDHSIDGCKSKDSGFASLERHHLSQGADSDSEDGNMDKREECGGTSNDLAADYVNQVSVTSENVVRQGTQRRHGSENVYDDLSTSLRTSLSGSLESNKPCFESVSDKDTVADGQDGSLARGEHSQHQMSDDLDDACQYANSSQLKLLASSDVANLSQLKLLASSDVHIKIIQQPDDLEPTSKASCNKKVVYNVDLSGSGISKSAGTANDLEENSGLVTLTAKVNDDSCVGCEETELKVTNEGATSYVLTDHFTPALTQDCLMSGSSLQHQLAAINSDECDDEDDDDDEWDDNQTVNVSSEEASYDTISLLRCSKADDSQENNSTATSNSMPSCSDGKSAVTTSKGTVQSMSTQLLGSKVEVVQGRSKVDDKSVTGESRQEGDLDCVDAKLARRPKLERNLSAEFGSDDSSDEDLGVYAEGFRRSHWVRVSQDGKLKFTAQRKVSSSTSPSTSPQLVKPVSTSKPEDLGSIVECETSNIKDEVFGDTSSKPRVFKQGLAHKRSDSTTSTTSELDFKRQYISRRKCLIQRADSQQEYHRMSTRVYDQDKLVVVQRTSDSDDLGLHLLDSHPAFITSVDTGSPADLAGIVEGQILVSVNDHTVLTTDHDDIISLIQSCEGQVRLGVANSDFQPVRDLQAAVMSGFMYKLGNSSFMKTWKKRYFILRQDNCLYYYKTDQDKHEPLGAVPLGGYTISRHTDTTRDFCFKAEKYGARTYYFMTDNRDQLTDWVGALTEAAARSKKRKESFLSVSSHNVGLPALDIRRPECSGYLAKLSPSHRSWRRRYCVLKDACVYYYKDVNSLRALGVAHLHGYKVDCENHPRRKHSFSLQPPEVKMRVFHFSADNVTDKKRWVESLIHSIQRWVAVDKEADC